MCRPTYVSRLKAPGHLATGRLDAKGLNRSRGKTLRLIMQHNRDDFRKLIAKLEMKR